MPNTYLALDYGTKRIGLAVGNDLIKSTQPLAAITTAQLHRSDNSIAPETILALIKSWNISHLVFGAPLDANGNETSLSKKIRKIGNQLSQVSGLPVSYADERYTSSSADRLLREHHPQGKKFSAKKIALRDSIAAQLILETYFSNNQSLD